MPVRDTSVVTVMTYAPISFPLYGLDAEWHGPRWLHHFNASSEGVASISLAHGRHQRPSPAEPWFSVTSAGARESRDDGWIALDVLHELTRVVMPELRERAMERYEHSAGRFVVDNVNDRSMWTRAAWTVNGHSVAASTFDLAGAWAGYAAVAGGSAQVFGSRQEDRVVRLVQLGDTSAYHFAAENPLDFPGTQQASAAAVWDSADRLWPNWPPHRDHNALLASDGVERS